jgi:trk system potassium uptake protein TrkH
MRECVRNSVSHMSGRQAPRHPRTLRRPSRVEVRLEEEAPKRRQVPVNTLPLILIGGFALAILIGMVLLMLPISSSEREWTSPIVALFVSTSAVCVTGLTPVDTATHWSGFGEAVIMLLIQFGGLGFMTSATLLFLLFGLRVGLRERIYLSQSMDLSRMGGVVNLTRRAIKFTLLMEAIGFVILSARFAFDESLGTAVWRGLFHSVSAFNNAGFDVMGGFRSLEGHNDVVVLSTVSVLVVVGGIGFIVVEDLLRYRRSRHHLSADSTVVLRATALLLAVGFVVFLGLEWSGVLEGRSVPDKLLQSAFHSVTPRTAGFNSVPVSGMQDETQFFTLGLMFIGAGSGSTAGGIKIGTIAVIAAAAFSAIRGREHPEAANRELARGDIDRALAVMLMAATLVFFVALILARLEAFDFLHVLFEATSAFGTVGLSTGITPALSDASLLVITATMFIGRLGPLTLILALVQRSQRETRRLPEERIRIG